MVAGRKAKSCSGGIEPRLVIDILESHGKRLFGCRGVGQPCLLVLAELVGGGFIQDDGLAFSLGVEAVGNSLVVGSEDDAETVLQHQVQLLIAGFDAWLAIEWLPGWFPCGWRFCGSQPSGSCPMSIPSLSTHTY